MVLSKDYLYIYLKLIQEIGKIFAINDGLDLVKRIYGLSMNWSSQRTAPVETIEQNLLLIPDVRRPSNYCLGNIND